MGVPFTKKEIDIAKDRNATCARALDTPMRLGMGERDTRG